MLGRVFLTLAFATLSASAADEAAVITTGEIRGFGDYEEARKEVISAALATAVEMDGMPYLYGGNGPKDGGFDCSGAMHYILHKVGLNPPRTSSDQFLWVKENGGLHMVANAAKDTEDESFSDLKPGDLVFWSGTYVPTDGRTTKITHVGMFLGYEKKDGRPVMINATNGRSYRGKKGNGFGVYDFRVPSAKSKSRLVAYGTPPGLVKK